MAATSEYRFESLRARQRRDAQRTAVYLDAGNDSPRCPWIYEGFEEPPRYPRSFGGSVDSGKLELRLERRLRAVIDNRRPANDQERQDG
jgi:hypothetical protein